MELLVGLLFCGFLLFQDNKIEALMRKLKYSRINITIIIARSICGGWRIK